MIQNYFLTAWRNLLKNKGFSFINIFGLAIGIVCAALIFLWVEHQYAYNRQLPGADNTYIFKNNQYYGEDIKTMSATNGPMAKAVYNEIPGFQYIARTLEAAGVFSTGDKFISQSGIYADSSFFNIYKFLVAAKQPGFSLADPTQIAISTKMAKAFFDTENVVGKTISFNKKDRFTVGMVYGIPSTNMGMQPAFVIPMNKPMADSNFSRNWQNWGSCGIRTYASLKPNVSADNINKQLKGYILKKTNNNTHHEIFLYPIVKMGLYNSFKNGVEDPGNGQIKYVKMFIVIAFIILLIACINFMNLSTARSEKRAKEIGLKKVVGATRPQLMMQFLMESILMAMLAVITSVLLLLIIVPLFSQWVDIPLKLNLFQPTHIFSIIAIGIFCGLLAGSYPSVYLSSFNPISAIKRRVEAAGNSTGLIRKGLVVAQFAVSIILIVATIVVYRQVKHAQTRDLGYDKDRVIQISTSEELAKNFSALKNALSQTGEVQHVAMASANMFSIYSNGGGFRWTGGEGKQDALISMLLVTPDYLKLMNVGLAEGRAFYDNVQSDSNNIIINHELAQLMDKEGHAGKILYRGDNHEVKFDIVGVTKSFLINDIYGNSPPTILFPAKPEDVANWGGQIFIKLKSSNNIVSQLKKVEAQVKKIDGNYPFEAKFLDDDFNNLFKAEKFVGTLAMLFGSLAILISCLGLFGLSAYMAEQRKKEIGVRKVVGASVMNITTLMSADFLKLVLIALIIAIPLAWYFMHNWLMSYTYRTGLDWWIFVLAALISVFIALFTVSFQAIKAALANPVKSLRTE